MAEKVKDTPRLRTKDLKNHRQGLLSATEVQTLTMIAKEHNRIPGKVNYDFPQTFYSTFPEIDQESYVTIGSSSKKRVHMAWTFALSLSDIDSQNTFIQTLDTDAQTHRQTTTI